jgi:prepilin-type N-terminal cleavage/methylation domain-containing protein
MKTELKAKFLQHLINKKKENEGFTLIELLVVIIIIGILAAIALPSFLNQANRARESEAKSYIGTMNRGQQAYFLEAQEFASDISFLGLGIATDTDNYSYVINRPNATSVNNQAQPEKQADATVRAYIGGVGVSTVTGTGEATTIATLCEGVTPPAVNAGPVGTETAGFPGTDAPTCPNNYKKIS